MNKFKKGDRVEFPQKGVTKYGVVSKGGAKKITVVLDGAEFEVKGHPNAFQPSNHPLPKDLVDSPMDKYSVVGYKKQVGHDDSECFVAYVTKNGKKILRAYDSGHGGGVEYHGVNGQYRNSEDEKQYYADAKAWAIQFGDNNGFGAADCWIEWYIYERPYGVTAQAYWNNFKDMLKGA